MCVCVCVCVCVRVCVLSFSGGISSSNLYDVDMLGFSVFLLPSVPQLK